MGTLCAEATDDFFKRKVEPILRQRCYECHSHAHKIESGLALDWRSGWEIGGSRGPAVKPGEPAASWLIRAILHSDRELQMPAEKLPAEEIEVLVQWVNNGAVDPRVNQPNLPSPTSARDWWSLRPLVRPAVPVSDQPHPIDAFIQAGLQSSAIPMAPPADRRTLIRRLSLDLIGLPPSPDEVADFQQDHSADAVERLIDRLLASDRYGERWARHWFDTIHFAESHGYEHDVGRDHAWRYRDYVIAALNRDIPWSDFVRQQLAADFFHPHEPGLTPALGFLGAGTFDLSTYSTAPITFDYLARDDLVHQTLSSFMSLTVNCARCHDHKFDPISQRDYYALQAVFAGVVKGDLAFDEDPHVARKRMDLQAMLTAASDRDSQRLLSDEYWAIVERWLAEHPVINWKPLDLRTFHNQHGTELTKAPDGLLLASGPAPEQETTVVTAQLPGLERLTAIRLDLQPDASLPKHGPGRAANGNLHLSEFEAELFGTSSPRPTRVNFARAFADFNQVDWSVDKSIDGNLQTAWGIHPSIGQQHVAIFQLAEPLRVEASSMLSITLKQLHGASHTLGAFRLSATDADPQRLSAIPYDIQQALQAMEQQGTIAALQMDAPEIRRAQRSAVAAYVLERWAREQLAALPPPALVYAAGKQVSIPTGNGGRQAATIPVPKTIHLLRRGDIDQPSGIVTPGGLSALDFAPAAFELRDADQEAERRGRLAEWIANPHNPLTWRSIVNRVWHYHFGRGLCDTPNDFGRMGSLPTHPELLDWLAVWFRDEAQGSLKALHRLIVTSAAYRRSSGSDGIAHSLDADNRWLGRQNRQRLDADTYRDAVLYIAGRSDFAMGGPSIQHFQQSKGPQSTPVLDYAAYDWNRADAGRRSIYRYVWRGIADPFMESLDFPDLGLLAPQRGFSVSALQSLTLYNHDFVLAHSLAFAERLQRSLPDRVATEVESPAELESNIRDAVQWVWCRAPTQDESALLVAYAHQHGLAATCRVLFNSNEFLFID